MAKFTVVTTVKDEGPYFLEWLAYHHLIGFDHFHVSANNCSDHTDEILEILDRQGLIHYNDNTKREKGEAPDPQRRAYGRARRDKTVMKSKYVCIIDGDEFFNIHAGDGHLNDLFAATGEFDLISPTWRVFGSNGRINFEEGLQSEQFTRTAKPFFPPHFRFWGIKTMFKPAYTLHFGIHRPHLRLRFRRDEAGPLVWLNGSGDDVYQRFYQAHWSSSKETYGNKLVQVNHYMVRSAEAFLMKRMRGTANTANEDRINFDYFKMFDTNDVDDRTLIRHAPAIKELIATWFRDIPGLEHFYRAAVAAHKGRIAVARAELEAEHPEMARALGILDEQQAA